MNKQDQKRRAFLLQLLGSGVLTAGMSALPAAVRAMGRVPGKMLVGKSIYKLHGSVVVDGKKATVDTAITPNSIIKTGSNSKVIFAVGKDAFILRSNSKLEIGGGETIIKSLRLVTGKLLSVFGRREKNQSLRVGTTVATIGIRGTGLYVEAQKTRSYVCTCYGKADIAAINDSLSKETVTTRHHDSPRYIYANAKAGAAIEPAPVINHTDEELELIETLVGRSVPFAFDGGYESSRSTDY